MVTPAAASDGDIQAPRPSRALVRLWMGVLLPPASWMVDFLFRYMAVRFANIRNLRWPFRVSTAAALMVLLLGATLCARALRQARRREDASQPQSVSRDEIATLAAWGLALAAFFLLLILAQAYPTFVLSVREIT
jgi:hypothetical protein